MSATADPLAPPAPFAAFERLPSGRVLVRDTGIDPVDARRVLPALEDAFARHDALGMAVAKRLRADGISAHGAFVVHPKGFVRNGRGAPRDAERFDREVDACDAGVAVVDGNAFTVARGEAILDPRAGYGALAMLAMSLEIRRRRAGRVVAVAAAVVDDAAAGDDVVETRGFRCGIARGHFRAHFGFDADACDLDAVARNPALASLRWNAEVWGAPAPFAKYDERGAYHWNLYATHDAYRRRADAIVAFLLANLPAGDAPIVDVGAGDALFAGLLSRTGARVVALDPEAAAVASARRALDEAGCADRVECTQGSAENMPFADGSFRAAMLLDVVEHLRNPVAALREMRRVLAPSGMLLVATPAWNYGRRNDPVYHLDEYREEELERQIRACGFEISSTARIRGAYDDILALARRAD